MFFCLENICALLPWLQLATNLHLPMLDYILQLEMNCNADYLFLTLNTVSTGNPIRLPSHNHSIVVVLSMTMCYKGVCIRTSSFIFSTKVSTLLSTDPSRCKTSSKSSSACRLNARLSGKKSKLSASS